MKKFINSRLIKDIVFLFIGIIIGVIIVKIDIDCIAKWVKHLFID